MEENKVNNGKVKKIIIAVIVVAVLVAIIFGIVNILKPTPEKTVKKAIKCLNKGDFSGLSQLIDVKGMTAYSNAYGDTDDFKDVYDDINDDWDDIEDEVEDKFESALETMEDDISNMDAFDVEVKEIKKGKKVSGTKLYKVKAKLKIVSTVDDETERDTSTYEIYLMKKDGKYYIVGVDGGDIDYSTSEFYYY